MGLVSWTFDNQSSSLFQGSARLTVDRDVYPSSPGPGFCQTSTVIVLQEPADRKVPALMYKTIE